MTSFVSPLLIETCFSLFSTSSAQCRSFSSNAGIFWLLPMKWFASTRMISGWGEETNISSTGPPIARMSIAYGTVYRYTRSLSTLTSLTCTASAFVTP